MVLTYAQQSIDEVVVVGYGVQKKANLTGAVATVSQKELKDRPVSNVGRALQGVIPNLNVTLSSGQPGAGATYNIRGTTSPNGGSPLVLIDGVEGDPAMLNPNDIESVSVLKDAASAAIYGSRAPYGVVLITTKDPGKLTDKFTINYTGNVSIQQPTAIPDVVDDGYVYSRLFYDAWYNYRFNEPTGFNNSQDFSRAWLDTFRQRKLAGNKLETTVEPDGKYVYYGNTDYYDALYKDTVIAQTHNISVSGSNGKISHYLSGRLYDYNGLFNFTPDTYRTMNLRSKVSSQVFKWLKISNNFDYTHDHYRQPMGYSKEGGGVLWRSLNDQGHPSSPIFNPDGTLTKSGAYAEVKNHRRPGDGQQLARPHDQDAQEHHHAQRHDAGEPPAPDGRLLVPHQGLHRDQKDHGHSLQRLRGRNRLPRHARDRRRDEGVAATDDLYRHQRLR